MSRYEQDRIAARRILADRLTAMDLITDKELEEHVSKDEPVSHTLLRLSEKSKVERALERPEASQLDAANSDKFLYGADGLPE